MSFWPTVKRVIREADIVLFIVDARMPILSMNREVKEKIHMYGKEMILVFNKIDLIKNKKLEDLKKEYKNASFVSGINQIGTDKLRKRLIDIAEADNRENMKLGVVGYPNVGKSAIINALSQRGGAKVSSIAGTTKGIQWIKAGRLKFVDSPGVIPYEDESQKLGILGAKNPERLKNPYQVAFEIIEMFLEKNKPALEKYYNTKLSDDPEEVFDAIGKRRGFLSKGGTVNETKTAIGIIHDWQKGKIRL